MADDMLDEAPAPAGAEGTPPAEGVETPPADGRPEGVPEKFWDPESGIVRTDALVKSYRELEKKLGDRAMAAEVPESYEFEVPGYDDLRESLGDVTEGEYQDVTAMMSPDCEFSRGMQAAAREAKVSQDQWSALARAFVGQQARAHSDMVAQARRVLLTEEKGDEKRLGERLAGLSQSLRQVYRDEPKKLAAINHITQVAEGVHFLEDVVSGRFSERLRAGGSSAAVPTGGTPARLTLADLRQIMAGQKYQDGDLATHRRVEEGFKLLDESGGL